MVAIWRKFPTPNYGISQKDAHTNYIKTTKNYIATQHICSREGILFWGSRCCPSWLNKKWDWSFASVILSFEFFQSFSSWIQAQNIFFIHEDSHLSKDAARQELTRSIWRQCGPKKTECPPQRWMERQADASGKYRHFLRWWRRKK